MMEWNMKVECVFRIYSKTRMIVGGIEGLVKSGPAKRVRGVRAIPLPLRPLSWTKGSTDPQGDGDPGTFPA